MVYDEESCVVLEHLIQESRELMLFSNAEFYAERLFSVRKNGASLLELAKTLMLGGGLEATVRLLREHFPFSEHFHGSDDAVVVPTLYRVFGTCLYRTDRLHEAEVSFRHALQPNHHAVLPPKERSACLYYLGLIHRNTNRETLSVDALSESISCYPFNWKAVEAFAQTSATNAHRPAQALERLYSSGKVAEYHRMFAQQGQPSSASLQHSRLPQPLQGQTTPPQGNLMRDNMASPAPVSPLLGAQPRVEVSEGGVEALMRILHAFTAILCSASQYNCDDVEQRCKKLPTALRKTHYIQGVLGSAYYDDGQHSKAADCFALMRRLCQYKIDDSLSLYSSCLWQLQREKDLAHLAQELVQMDKLSLVTQIVLGNAHSIAGDHEHALQFFARGCQVDQYSAYANTLRGMEHLVLEELDDASQAFRVALRLDSRHYPAWHGLGSVASKQEKFGEAVVHFEKACKINPNSPLLLAYANALMSEGRGPCLQHALATINRVLEKHPEHAFALFRKGELLLQLPDCLDEALRIALTLYELAPNEAKANLLLGRVYRKQGDTTQAQQFYNNALGLDPKDTPSLKYEADRLQTSGDSDEFF